MYKFRQRILEASSTLYIAYFCMILVFVGMVGFMATDMYVPSLPNIARYFGAPASSVKLTVTLFYLTYAAGQLLYGPVVDSFGRKRVFALALALGLCGSVICAVAPQLWWLYLGRLLQGLGYAVISVSLMSMARDILTHQQFVQVGSIISTAFSIGPIIAPIIGAYIEHAYQWRMVFVVLSVYSVLVIVVVLLMLPETHALERRQKFHIKPIMSTYLMIIKNTYFVGNALAKAAATMGFVVFFTVSSFMLQDHMGVNVVTYGWITMALTCAVLLSKVCNSVMLRYVGADITILYSVVLLAAASALLLLFALLGYFSIATLLIPFVLYGLAAGVLFSNTTTTAFKPFHTASGSISALLGGIQFLAAFVGAAIASHLSDDSLLPLAILISSIGFSLLIIYYFMVVRNDTYYRR